MSLMNATYVGSLRCESNHVDSGTRIETDAPKDNQGEGARFSPTDLLCVSLTTCILTTMGIKAKALGIDMSGVRCEMKKVMTKTPPRKVDEVIINMDWGGLERRITPEQMESLKRSGLHCPVSLSLDPSVKKTIHW